MRSLNQIFIPAIVEIVAMASTEVVGIAELIKCKAPMQINGLYRVSLYMFG
jgi:hypothetical protein